MNEDLCVNCGGRYNRADGSPFHCPACRDRLSMEDRGQQAIRWATFTLERSGLSATHGPSVGDPLPRWFRLPGDEPLR